MSTVIDYLEATVRLALLARSGCGSGYGYGDGYGDGYGHGDGWGSIPGEREGDE